MLLFMRSNKNVPRSVGLPSPLAFGGVAITQSVASEGCANDTHRQKRSEHNRNTSIVIFVGECGALRFSMKAPRAFCRAVRHPRLESQMRLPYRPRRYRECGFHCGGYIVSSRCFSSPVSGNMRG